MAEDVSSSVRITSLTHDLGRKRSIVLLVWDGDPEKRVALPVAFGCSLDDLPAEAEKALRGLAAEIAVISVKPAE